MPYNLTAHTETAARDCDGMHYREADYEMEPAERTDPFGDLTFFYRVMSYIASPSAEFATLQIRQDENGLPVFDYSESTEEGYLHNSATFTKGE